jgi:signal transduction histidine kinase
LGLAVCHGIVAAHGGEMRVESEVGRGTRFAMILPTSRKQAGDHG